MLLKLRAEARKAEIGFVSQKAAEAQETRRAAAETRKTELHIITMDIKKQQLEREKYNAILAAMKAGEKLASAQPVPGVVRDSNMQLPPNWEKLAA